MYSSPVICWNIGESWWKMWIHPIYMIKCTTSNPTKPRQWTSRNMTINENLYFKNCWEDFAKPIVYLSARLIDHPWIFCWNFVTFYLHPKRTKHIVYFCFLIFLWKLMYQVDFRTVFQQLRPETFAWGHLETMLRFSTKTSNFDGFWLRNLDAPNMIRETHIMVTRVNICHISMVSPKVCTAKRVDLGRVSRWWQLKFFLCSPLFGEDSQLSYFSDGLKPPTRFVEIGVCLDAGEDFWKQMHCEDPEIGILICF